MIVKSSDNLRFKLYNRISEPFLIDTLAGHFNKKNSNNIKKLRIRYEVFSLDSAPEQLLMSGVSGKISDSASREHGILDFTHATPLSSCERGGRKVFVISQGQIAPDVEPRFQVRDRKTLMARDLERNHFELICVPVV